MKIRLLSLLICFILNSVSWSQDIKKALETNLSYKVANQLLRSTDFLKVASNDSIRFYVIGGGGVDISSNNSYRISATVSQTAVDSMTSTANRLFSGFWIPRIRKVTEETKPTSQPSGSAETAYRLISVPFELDAPTPAAVLDKLGTYDQKEWRFFDYEKDSLNEFPNTRNFEPGRSFFLIVKNGANIAAGPGKLVLKSVVPIDLDSGWNLVANPFNFDIPVSTLSINERLITLTANGWSDPMANPIDTLKQWEGYALKVPNPTTLMIRRSSEVTQSLAKNTTTQEGWSIQIKAQCQLAQDRANYVGVRLDASEEWDHYDFYEPPPIGEYVMLYFPHRDWSERPDIYAGDFRPENGVGHIWDFEVRSNIEDVINLTFTGLEQTPEFEVVIVDKILNRTQNLREDNRFQFGNLKKDQIHKFVLIVGEQAFVEDNLLQLKTTPFQYELSANFPNPFNLRTAIRYALPEPQKVTLRVFNLLGQEVIKILDSENRKVGFHIEYWDGKNRHGSTVASGIYLYQLHAGKFVETRKMMLLK